MKAQSASDLEQLFRETVPTKFAFLRDAFGYSLRQEYPWRFVAEATYCRVFMEYEKDHFSCWLERPKTNVPEENATRAIGVRWIAECQGYVQPPRLFGLTREVILRREMDEAVLQLQQYGSKFLQGNFAEWHTVLRYIGKSLALT